MPNHTLSDIDTTAHTATCAVCGANTPIRLKRDRGLWQCYLHYKESKNRRAQQARDRQGPRRTVGAPELQVLRKQNVDPHAQRFWSNVQIVEGDDSCWHWRGKPNTSGYGLFGFYGTKHLAHRVSYALTHEDFDPTLNVLHHCDNPICVRPSHLFDGTQEDNNKDMFAKDRGKPLPGARRMAVLNRGEGNANAQLTEADVREIRRRYVKGQRGCKQALAAEFGVSPHHIGDIVGRVRWKHLSDD